MLDQKRIDEEANRIPPTVYQSVEIRIAKTAEPNIYLVELSHPGSRDFPSRKMILNSNELLVHSADTQDYGLFLGQALFADTALGAVFRESLAVLQREGKSLRLRLRLDNLDLHDIRWERLHYPLADQWHPLAITALTPFSRYILAEDWGQPQPISQRPLRILVIIATPEDLHQYDLSPISQAERQAVHAIFDGLPDVLPTYLETGTATPPTLEHIRRELASGYHMVHFVCHGTVRPRGTVLHLEKEGGRVELVSAGKLIDSFRAVGTPPHFCFLAACESAANSRFDAFTPLGPRLVAEGGLTAVVAMSDKVSLTTASKFTAQFYIRLLSHGYVDLAVNEARTLVRDNWDWSVPVLFSRLLDNRLLAMSNDVSKKDLPYTTRPKQQDSIRMSLSQIRRQLNQMFDDPELDAFCMDHFPEVYDKFGRGMRKDEKITLLLDYCRRIPKGFETLREAIHNEYQVSDYKRNELKAHLFELEQMLNTEANQSKTNEAASQEERSETTSTSEVAKELPALISLIASSYNIMELADLAQSVGLYVSALPFDKPDKQKIAREIVLLSNRLNRLDELVVRLKLDGKL